MKKHNPLKILPLSPSVRGIKGRGGLKRDDLIV